MKRRDVLELLTLAALWGGSFLFMRIGAPQFGPFALMFLRTGIGALVLVPFVVRTGGVGELRANAGRIAWNGLLNSALPFSLYGYALIHLSAGFSSILNAAVPFWGALIAFAWLGERLSGGRVVGLLVGFGGVVVLVGDRIGFSDDGDALPIAAVIAATVSYGIASVAAKKQLGGVTALTVAAGSQLFAALMLLPLAFVAWPEQPPDARAWIATLLLGVLCTGVAFVLYFRLIEHVGSTRALTVTFLVPVFAMIWGAMLLDETITARMIAAAATILAGTAMTTGLADPRRWCGRLRAPARGSR